MLSMVMYKNGNYTVVFDLKSGTKMRVNDLDNLTPDFAESMDVKITNRCNMGCSMCHENSTVDGAHGDILNATFINTLKPYTEMAIGGGNPLEHPDLYEFLKNLKYRKVIPSMTVHQKHFMENLPFLRKLRDEQLIYGLGVSINAVYPDLVKALQEFPNAVCHTIAGLTSEDTFRYLSMNNLKVLILGYKNLRRGASLYEKYGEEIDKNIKHLAELLPKMRDEKWFSTMSFDNLAIEQLEPRRLMTEDEYKQFYMGDDGGYTYYIDLVNKQFAQSSTSTKRYELLDDAQDMFNVIREAKKNGT